MSKFSLSFYLTVASISFVSMFVFADESSFPQKEDKDNRGSNEPLIRDERTKVKKLQLENLDAKFSNIGAVSQKKENIIKGNIYGPHGMNLLRLAEKTNSFISIRDCSTYTIEGVIAGGAGKDFHIKYKSSKIPVAGLRGRIPVRNKYAKKQDSIADSDLYHKIISKKDLPDTPYTIALAETKLNNYTCYLYDKTGNNDFIGDVQNVDDYFVYRCDDNGINYWINLMGRNVNLTPEQIEKIQPVYVLASKTPISQSDLTKVSESLNAKRIIPINVPNETHDGVDTVVGIDGALQDDVRKTAETSLYKNTVKLNYSLLSTYKMLHEKKCKVYMSQEDLLKLRQNDTANNLKVNNVSYQCCDKLDPLQCEWRDNRGEKVLEPKQLEAFSAYVPVKVIVEEKSIIPDYDTSVVRSKGYDFPKNYDPQGELGFVNQEDRYMFEYLKRATEGMVFHGADADNPVGFLFEMSAESPYTTFAPALPGDETPDAKVYSSKDPVEFINLVNRYRKAGYNVILNPRTGVLLRYDDTSKKFMYDPGVMLAGANKPDEKHWYASANRSEVVNFGAIETGIKHASDDDQKSIKSFLNSIYSLQKLIAIVYFEPPIFKDDATGSRTPFCSFDSNQGCNEETIKAYHFRLIEQTVSDISVNTQKNMNLMTQLMPQSAHVEKLQTYLTNLLNVVSLYKQKNGVDSSVDIKKQQQQ